jgi:hypothetical protein
MHVSQVWCDGESFFAQWFFFFRNWTQPHYCSVASSGVCRHGHGRDRRRRSADGAPGRQWRVQAAPMAGGPASIPAWPCAGRGCQRAPSPALAVLLRRGVRGPVGADDGGRRRSHQGADPAPKWRTKDFKELPVAIFDIMLDYST